MTGRIGTGCCSSSVGALLAAVLSRSGSITWSSRAAAKSHACSLPRIDAYCYVASPRKRLLCPRLRPVKLRLDHVLKPHPRDGALGVRKELHLRPADPVDGHDKRIVGQMFEPAGEAAPPPDQGPVFERHRRRP